MKLSREDGSLQSFSKTQGRAQRKASLGRSQDRAGVACIKVSHDRTREAYPTASKPNSRKKQEDGLRPGSIS